MMQDCPLTLNHFVSRAQSMHRASRITAATPEGGRQRVDLASWARRVQRVGPLLDRLGVSRGARVGTLAWNTVQHLELTFGVPCSGRVLHAVNIQLPPDQAAYTIDHAEDEVLFVEHSLLARVWPMLRERKAVRHIVVLSDDRCPTPPEAAGRILDYEELMASAAGPGTFSSQDEYSAAVLCYTSGTTGRPKGVLYSHRSLFLSTLALMTRDLCGIGEDDTVMPAVPLYHAGAWGYPHAAIAAGADLVLAGPHPAPETLVDLLEQEHVTVAAAVPTVWAACAPLLPGRRLGSLRRLGSGGALTSPDIQRAYQLHAGVPLLTGWGMTETSAVGTLPPDPHSTGHSSAVGRLPAGSEGRIADPRTGTEQPWDGQSAGELQLRAPWAAAAYFGHEDTPTTPDGWLRTGDLATIGPYGHITLAGRLNDMIKSGGEWISPLALENAIMSCPGIRQAAVIGVDHPHWGQRPAAYIVPAGPAFPVSRIRDHLSTTVPSWHIPDDFILIDTLPTNSTGKPDKQALHRDYRHRHAPAATPQA
ncbi:AMP-binding protein [Streptomyces sp. NPDC096030]|uniref:AMP-binding protein n=1 Tax=Streptomyces sp. NPDC096030 TaxID=3155423 RepID=UPI00331E5C1F